MRPAHVVLEVPRAPAELMPLLREGLARQCVPVEHDAGRRLELRAGELRVEVLVRGGRSGGSVIVARGRGQVSAGLLSTIALTTLYGVMAVTSGQLFGIVTGTLALVVALVLIVVELSHWIASHRDRHARFAELATGLARIVAPLQLSEGTASPYRSDAADADP